MSTAAVSSSSLAQSAQQYFQTRQSDLQKLGQALQSGDTAAAQKEFSTIQTLGQSGPVSGGNEFFSSKRQQDFNAIGQALQSGDIQGAQQAFAQLQSSFQRVQSETPTPDAVVNLSAAATAGSASAASQPASGSTGSANGSEIVLNFGNITPGEQISIGISNSGNGSEQLNIGVSQQNQTPEQISLNLNQNSNQNVVLNFLNSATSGASGGSSTGTTTGNNVNVSA